MGVFDEKDIAVVAKAACDLQAATRLHLRRGLGLIARTVYGPTSAR